MASGSASVTSTSARMIASGVRSSCEASATKRRWPANAVSEPGEHGVEGVGELLELVVGPVELDPLVQVRLREPRAVVVIACTGRRTRPAMQPAEPEGRMAIAAERDGRLGEQVLEVLVRRSGSARRGTPSGRRCRRPRHARSVSTSLGDTPSSSATATRTSSGFWVRLRSTRK